MGETPHAPLGLLHRLQVGLGNAFVLKLDSTGSGVLSSTSIPASSYNPGIAVHFDSGGVGHPTTQLQAPNNVSLLITTTGRVTGTGGSSEHWNYWGSEGMTAPVTPSPQRAYQVLPLLQLRPEFPIL